MHSSHPPVLVMTSDEPFGSGIKTDLRANGYEVCVAASLQRALQATESVHPLLVILDRRTVSIKLVRQSPPFRKMTCLSVQPLGMPCNEDDCTQDLEDGADASMCGKTNRQIIAFVRALVRRSRLDVPRRSAVGAVEMDFDRYEVRVNSRPVELTRKQYQILEVLFLNAARVVTKEELIQKVWGHDADLDEHTITVHINAIRRKIELDTRKPGLLQTVQGVGYRLRR
jgi:DNA-binding response OmpR family regulator